MITFFTLSYVLILLVLIKMGKIPNNLITWITVPVWIIIQMFVLYFPMQMGAPSGQARLLTYSVAIVPNVSGEVVSVDVETNQHVKEGDVLFHIDPKPYEFAARSARAQLVEAKQNVLKLKANLDAAEAGVLQAQSARDISKQNYERHSKANTGSTQPYSDQQIETARLKFEADQAGVERALAAKQVAEIAVATKIDGVNTTEARLLAAVDKAQYDLDQTVVRAPSDGYVTALALRTGQRVSPATAALSFIEDSPNIVSVQIDQIYHRHIRVGNPVEVTFKSRPGQIFTGRVDSLSEVNALGQGAPAGTVPVAQRLRSLPFFIHVAMDDTDAANAIPAGSVGLAAVYTDTFQPVQAIQKVTIRIISITNYIIPTF